MTSMAGKLVDGRPSPTMTPERVRVAGPDRTRAAVTPKCKKAAPKAAFHSICCRQRPSGRRVLLDLGFLERDVLARDGIVFAELELLGRGPRILLGHVEIAGVGGADQSDQDGRLLGHGLSLQKQGRN